MIGVWNEIEKCMKVVDIIFFIEFVV